MISAKACVVFILRNDKRRVFRPYYDCDEQKQLEKNGTRSDRLDAYLHMAQLMYVARHNERLFSDDMYAKNNCGAVPMVLLRSGDPEYVKTGWKQEFEGHEAEQVFLQWFYDAWADCDIEILHEWLQLDPEWVEKHGTNEPMDPFAHADTYCEWFEKTMDQMP